MQDNEIIRIEKEYAFRDQSGLNSIYNFGNPAFVFHMQEREWGMLKILRDHGLSVEGLSIFEVGCGNGNVLQRLLDLGAKDAGGIDLINRRIEEAKLKYPRLQLMSGDAAHIPCDDGSFDMVTQFMCLSSILDIHLRKKIAEEMWRITKPGGAILFYDLRPLSLILRVLIACKNAFVKTSSARQTPVEPLAVKEVERLFGVPLTDQRSVCLPFQLSGLSDTHYLTAQFLSKLKFLHTHHFILIRKPN